MASARHLVFFAVAGIGAASGSRGISGVGHRHASRWLCSLVIATTAACATVSTARMALPVELSASPSTPLAGAGAGRRGNFAVAGTQVRFERSADRLSLFDVAALDRARLQLSLSPAADTSSDAPLALSCKAHRTELSLGIVTGTPRALQLRCAAERGVTHLLLDERRTQAGTRAEHSGEWREGALTLRIHSEHRLVGAAWASAEPVGYVMRDAAGRVVAALDLAGGTPRLLQRDAASAEGQAALRAALVLALWWDPARVS